MTGGLNGIIAPSQTYQRQVHHRTTARALRQSTGMRSKTATTGVGATTTATAAAGGGGGTDNTVANGRHSGKSVESKQKDEINVCPLRHAATEVCNSCLSRYV